MKKKRLPLTSSLKAIVLAVIAAQVIAWSPRPSGAQAPSDDPPAIRKGEVLVEIKPDASIDAVNARIGTATLRRIYGTNFYRLVTPRLKKEYKFVKRLSRDPDVLSAAVNPVVTSPFTVFARSTMGFPDGYATPGRRQADYKLQQLQLNLDEVRLRSTGAGVVVAVIDTGVALAHPDIASHLWTNAAEIDGDRIDNDSNGLIDDFGGWNFVDDNNNVSEGFVDTQSSIAGHGSFITGIIALVAPGAKIMPVRAFDPGGASDAFTVASAIKYAADRGAQVINLSFGSAEESSLMRDAVKYARQRGAIVIAAIGNENQSSESRPQFPAAWKDDSMAVAAVDSAGRRAQFSNFGAAVSVSAPGVRLISTYPGPAGPDYATWSGTSFAAPLAAAEAALLLSTVPRKEDTRQTIENTADPIDDMNPGFAGKLGKGLINPLAALQSLEPTTPIFAEIDLRSTSVEPSAFGEASIEISGTLQEFELDLKSLTPRAGYRIVIDGAVIIDGSSDSRSRATNFGDLKLEFSTTPDGSHLPLPPAITPVNKIKHVEVRDLADRIVLQGDFGAGPGGGPPSQSIEKEARLVSTGVIPQASGRARAEVEREREKLRVEADTLISGAVYDIIADGLNLGSAVASQSGYFRAEFTSDGSSGLVLPQALRPVTKIKQIRISDSTGRVVLQGDFQAGGDDIGDDDDGGGGGGGGGEIRREAPLNGTGVDPDAEGRVRTRSSSSREELDIEADRLSPGVAYTVIVDGLTLGSFNADSGGSIDLEWSTEAGKPQVPPQLRPVSNVRHVEIRDSLNRTVLVGDLP